MSQSGTAEVNFDGLVGPTHNYSGLSMGNRASSDNAGDVSSPRTAALQGLAKMRRLHSLGLVQGVFPPPIRPDPLVLRSLGFDSLGAVAATVPNLVPLLMSASSMWAANAATVSPSADTSDGRVHFTPANLVSTPHRSLEPEGTESMLRAVFADPNRFEIHPPLPSTTAFADEGAAHHGRIVSSHGDRGTQLFVYGREADEHTASAEYPRRQSRLAGELIAASHGLDPHRVVHVRQAARAIDAGAFHNDVVSVVNQRVLFTHEFAYDDPESVYRRLGIDVVEVGDAEVPLADAVSSYLFNSQLITMPDGTMMLVAPGETDGTHSTREYLARAVADPTNPISSLETMDLRESMRNGGGPACLRLRVVLTSEERNAVSGRVIVDDEVLDELTAWVNRHYRDELDPADLVDPSLVEEVKAALAELALLLDLPDLYNLRS
ncbi:MAG: N-succinylarginine dihydrolase [Acidimicrobiia bacterium]|nr:N-succinylarginine dihydrolase [Acidimicrobiia bacterium]